MYILCLVEIKKFEWPQKLYSESFSECQYWFIIFFEINKLMQYNPVICGVATSI